MYVYFMTGLFVCILFGMYFANDNVWNSHFSKIEIYLKAGEYGESEGYKYSWSLWKEPLNAWTSLAYTLFGCVIFLTGVNDLLWDPHVPFNNMSDNPTFSVIYGISCIYLGFASFLFHASHSEVWRKADAGMTSGVAVVPFVFGILDRIRPPAMSSLVMSCLAILFQMSLTHGYLPYGSSDILLPSLLGKYFLVKII